MSERKFTNFARERDMNATRVHEIRHTPSTEQYLIVKERRASCIQTSTYIRCRWRTQWAQWISVLRTNPAQF
jgi:hypothetical protein